LEEELAARRAEWPISRYEIGSVDAPGTADGSEPVAILAHYTASLDQMVFLLTTLVPFRHRGIAQAMLGHWAERATAAGARSLLINCDEHGRPAQLYRQMGFTDPVYWHRRYQRDRANP
jgi:GNAT superfamily N-acetyltransferase